MDKVIKNGEVAVLYSPRHGAGWYSWNTKHKECVFCPEIVELVERKEKIIQEKYPNHFRYSYKWYEVENDPEVYKIVDEIKKVAKQKFGEEFYSGGASDLTVEYVPQGSVINIEEFDGKERIEYIYLDPDAIMV